MRYFAPFDGGLFCINTFLTFKAWRSTKKGLWWWKVKLIVFSSSRLYKYYSIIVIKKDQARCIMKNNLLYIFRIKCVYLYKCIPYCIIYCTFACFFEKSYLSVNNKFRNPSSWSTYYTLYNPTLWSACLVGPVDLHPFFYE